MKKTSDVRSGIRLYLTTAILIAASLLAGSTGVLAQAQPVKNIVIVHGAFADGSGWKGVYEAMTKKGYHVAVVQNPLTSLKDDVDATNRIIEKQDGPVILVGHSWGGVVITEAGMNPKVVGLVYVAAFVPDKGENAGKLASSLPAAPENGIMAPDANGIIYYDRAKFHAGFAADLSQAESDFMADSQQPIVAECFGTPVAAAAWQTKPSYAIVATEDKSINPDIERTMYKRAGSKVTEIKGCHTLFISHPQEVAKVIIAAAEQK